VDQHPASPRRKASRRTKWIVAGVVLSLVAAACGGGGDPPSAGVGKDFRNADAGDIEPPARVDPTALALPGMILWTNSASWRRQLETPEGPGVAVLFIQPGTPANDKGIARGELLTKIDGDAVTNHEHAISLLHGRPGEKRTRGDEEEREVEISLERPRQRSRQYINSLLNTTPNDAVLHFLRAQSLGGSVDENLEDLNRAIELDARFVEAMSERASIRWVQRLRRSKEDARRIATDALAGWENALDLEPRNALLISIRAAALVDIGQNEQGKREVEKSLAIDPSQAQALFTLARAEFNLKRPQEALGPARGAVELNPYSNLFYWRLLERIFLGLKRKDDCVKTAAAVTPYVRALGSGAADEAKALTDLCK
jgi:hypothetical protein